MNSKTRYEFKVRLTEVSRLIFLYLKANLNNGPYLLRVVQRASRFTDALLEAFVRHSLRHTDVVH